MCLHYFLFGDYHKVGLKRRDTFNVGRKDRAYIFLSFREIRAIHGNSNELL